MWLQRLRTCFRLFSLRPCVALGSKFAKLYIIVLLSGGPSQPAPVAGTRQKSNHKGFLSPFDLLIKKWGPEEVEIVRLRFTCGFAFHPWLIANLLSQLRLYSCAFVIFRIAGFLEFRFLDAFNAPARFKHAFQSEPRFIAKLSGLFRKQLIFMGPFRNISVYL
jgi:hypothetical protein